MKMTLIIKTPRGFIHILGPQFKTVDRRCEIKSPVETEPFQQKSRFSRTGHVDEKSAIRCREVNVFASSRVFTLLKDIG